MQRKNKTISGKVFSLNRDTLVVTISVYVNRGV